MRRILAVPLAALVLAVVVGSASAGSASSRSWASPQIASVVDAGLMAPSVTGFRPDDALTWSELAGIVASLGGAITVTDPDRPVTIRELDAQLVKLAGLRSAARTVRSAARDASLAPTASLGTETIARLLGLRINHEQAEEKLELQLSEPATRAEAAYSVARLLAIGEAEIEAVRAAVDELSLPTLTEWQRVVLSRALKFVGSPYVWAGTSERPQQLFGTTMPGGFDCSGFVWRVYKVEPIAGAPLLQQVLKGRTSYAMSGEVPTSARIARADLQPGDVIFFGANGPRSKPSQVGHMGIYLGDDWFVHSSRYGTTLAPMTGWYDRTFAWGRRPLAEAGVAGALPSALAAGALPQASA